MHYRVTSDGGSFYLYFNDYQFFSLSCLCTFMLICFNLFYYKHLTIPLTLSRDICLTCLLSKKYTEVPRFTRAKSCIQCNYL